MPAALDIDREAVRVLVVAIGPRAAAREMGLPEATVQAWSAREGWLGHVRPVAVVRPSSMVPATVATKSPAEAMESAMDQLNTRSKLGFAKAAVRVAEDAADKPVAALLEDALSINTWAKTAALAGGWAGTAGATTTVAVNILSQSVVAWDQHEP